MTTARDRRQTQIGCHPLDDIQVDLTCLAFRDALPLVILAGVCIVVATIIRSLDTLDWMDWLFCGLFSSLSLVRIAICLRFQAFDPGELSPHTARRWGERFAVATIGYTLVFAFVTYYQFAHHDVVGECLCTLGTFGLDASYTARAGLPRWFNHSCSLILLGGLGISGTQLITHSLYLSLALLGVIAYIQWVSAETRYKIVVEQLRGAQKLRTLAESDPLTALANRRSFQKRVETACTQSFSFAVLCIDLDRFKSINDTHGHTVGDELLQSVAVRLQRTVRSTDLVARFGGDEFAVLYTPLTQVVDAEQLAARIVAELSQPFELTGQTVQIGASVGVRIADAAVSPNEDPTALLKAADQALYRVKRSGGGDLSFAQQ
jgi:diguanylate cyclase (GGDEF)-like protein